MSKLWFSGGKVVIDDLNRLILCDACPCGPGVVLYGDTESGGINEITNTTPLPLEGYIGIARIIAYTFGGTSTGVVTPSGWTVLQSGLLIDGFGSTGAYWVGYRVMTASEPISWTVNGGGVTAFTKMSTFIGGTTPLLSNINTGTGATVTANSLTVGTSGSAIFAVNLNTQLANISDLTLELTDQDFEPGTASSRMCMAGSLNQPVGPTGDKTASNTSSTPWAAVMIVLPPA